MANNDIKRWYNEINNSFLVDSATTGKTSGSILV